ncbi:restriction endonuclease subunit S [Aeromonas sp. MR16]|uniref:restriction endonuclease subunit S n=1 Tax=Aeromonas sp. MR16 TaxID=2923420 RepID=UPI001F4A5E4E|nr:restriction endonuclease subunit S [Aeromonas sp. MR16]MCH7371351.1 restriction endonuclease subunit S [Aeromonas sp. MR16]
MAEQMMQGKASEIVAKQIIPAGYKQTEVGVIPKDWEVMLVGDSFTVCNNLRLPISSKVRDGMSGSYPYYGPTKIQGYINEYRVEGEFALIGEDGDHFLKFDSVNQTQLVSGKFNVNNHAHLIKGNVGSAKWFYWFFRNLDISIYLTRQGAGRFKLNKASLERIQCAIPPTEEQLAITTVLSDSDALIVSLEQLIAKKQAIKTASMQQLLTGRTRLPQFARGPDGAPKSYKSSELGQIPEDWDVVCAGDLGKFRGGNGFPVIEQGKLNGEYPFYKVSDMNNEGNDVYMSASNNWISKEDQSRIGSFVFPSGCIVFAKVGAAVFLERKKILSMPSCIDNNMAALELNIAKCDVNFVYHFLQSIRFGDFVSTTALPSLNASVLSKIKIIMPLIKEQTAIATILSDMDNELQALTQKLEKARALKQGMMQQLLTGHIRLLLPKEA